MKIEKYTKVEHFISDASFINWVNKADLSDINFWDNWINDNGDKKHLVDAASDIIKGISFNKSYLSNQEVDEKWILLESKIKVLDNKPVLSLSVLKQKKLIAIAASLALLICSYFIFKVNENTDIVHKTAYGEIINLKLSDGTEVILNSNSTLSYNINNPRIVKLHGEAFFEVNKDLTNDSKFSVTTEDLKVEVYGTEFNVNSRNAKTRVFLQEGKVNLKLKNGTSKSMIPGDLISYSYANDIMIEEKSKLKPEIQTSWKEGSLIFDRTTLQEAISQIEDTYGVQTVFEDESIKNIILTGAVPTKNLNIALKTLEKSAQIDIVNKNNKLYIRKK